MSNKKTNYTVARFEDLEKNETTIEQHSSLHRFLNLSFALVITVLTVGIAWFFGDNAVRDIGSRMTIEVDGKVVITDEFGKSREAVDKIFVYEGETIETDEFSSASIKLPDLSELRLDNNSKIKINKQDDFYINNGHIWLFSAGNVTIGAEKVNFIAENTSADFLINDVYEVSSWRHNLEVDLTLDEAGLSKSILLPVGTRIMFSPKQLNSDFDLLRFSKLKKELKLHFASMTDWESINLEKDQERLLVFEDEAFSIDISAREPSESFFFMKMFFAFFPEKKLSLENNFISREINKVFKELSENNFQSAKRSIIGQNFSENQLEDMWLKTRALSSTKTFLEAKHAIQDIWLKNFSDNKEELQTKFLRSSLAMLEDYTKNRNEPLLTIELDYYKNLWNKFEGDDYLSELDSHREAVYAIMNYYVDRIDSNFVALDNWLDDLAIMSEVGRDQDVLRLEIAQKNLSLVEIFINSQRYFLAQEIIEDSKQRLAIEKVPEISNVSRQIVAKEELLNEKLEFIGKTGDMDEEQFRQYLLERQKEEELLAELRGDSEDYLDQMSDEEKLANIKEFVRESFSKEGLTLISYNPEGSSDNIFVIDRAVLPDGKGFSAVYNRQTNALSDIIFDDGTEYTVGVKLTHIIWLSDQLFAEVEDGGEHAVADEDNENDPTYQPISSNLAVLLKKKASNKMEEFSIKVSAKDLEVISTNQVSISNAVMEDVAYTVSFDFNVDNSYCTNIKVGNIEIDDVEIKDLKKEIIGIAEEKAEMDSLIKSVESAFNSLGIRFEIGKNVLIDKQNLTARFSKLVFKYQEEEFVVSGVYDIEKLSFITIAEENKKFETIRNINILKFAKSIEDAYQTKQEEIKDEQEASKEEQKRKEMLKSFKALLDLYGTQYVEENIQIFPQENKIVFTRVYLENYEIWIAGEYDTEKEILLYVTSANFEPKENITFIELDTFLMQN